MITKRKHDFPIKGTRIVNKKNISRLRQRLNQQPPGLPITNKVNN